MNKHLIKAQKGEMDAVILYQKLAKMVDSEEERKLMLSVAADEGKHAAILKRYTKVTVKGSSLKATAVSLMYQLLGRKKAFTIVSNGEYDSINSYKPLLAEFPDIQEIMDDENRHGDLMKELAARYVQ